MLVIACGVVAALHVGKLPPALPVLRDALGVSLVQAGFLLSVVQAAGMVLALALGLGVARLGLRRSLITGLLILAAASVAGSFAQGAGGLLLGRAAEGAGFLLVSLSAPALIRALVPPQRLNLRLGLWGTYMPTGMALALLVGPAVMARYGWQAWWLGLGLLAAVMAAWALRVLGWNDPGTHPLQAASPTPMTWTAVLRQTLGRRGPWLVALAFGAYSSQWITVIGFLPTIYAEAGVAQGTAGLLTALAAAVNIIGNVMAGRLLHRGRAPVQLLLIGFTTMGLTAFMAFGLPEAMTAIGRYAAVLAFSAVGGLIPGTLFALAVRVAPHDQAVPAVVGWTLQCSAFGQFIGPPVAAWWTSHHGGWSQTWVTTASAAAAGLLLALALGRALRR
ncbi:MAG: MFS transporter [Rubrivivax sp.]|nr:MFS transporter [Rubrivivax sp.]